MAHPGIQLRILVSVFSFFVAISTLAHAQGTRRDFYAGRCSSVESVVRSTVESHFRSNPSIAPGILRMHFHDCFVRGCDASVLLSGDGTERTAAPNLGLRGFEVIDDAKAQLESRCPGIVSCADILALAARDSVVLTRGVGWRVPLGRRDGTVSVAAEANNLPAFFDSVDVQRQKFAAKGLNEQDLVTLVGGHTIGTAACQFFRDRFFNFNNTGSPDPSANPSFISQIQAVCPLNGDGSRRVALDNGSQNRFDTSYFRNLRDGRGILESDQALWTDPSTRRIVQRFLGLRGLLGLRFDVVFGQSMVRMSNIEVKTGGEGEIRRVCSAVN